MKRGVKLRVKTLRILLVLCVANVGMLNFVLQAAGQVTAEIKELRLGSNDNYDMKHGDGKRVIVPPHWVKDATSEPVFYVMDDAINVDAKFELSESWSGGATVVYASATGNDVLTVPETSTTVYNGNTYFEIETQTTEDAGTLSDDTIKSVDLSFKWEYSLDGKQTWQSGGTTTNDCYVILDSPESPWSPTGVPVYVEMMDYACVTMDGATDEFSAMTKLTEGLAGFMKYNGSTRYTRPYYVRWFYVWAFVMDCDGYSSGPEDGNDCRDFACVTKCMSAAVGITDSWVRIAAVDRFGSGFDTRPIKPSGQSAEDDGVTWNFHQINYRPVPGTWDMGDASLLLDGDTNDGNGWTSPGVLANYDIDWDDYEDKLTTYTLDEIDNWGTCYLTEDSLP